MSEQEPQKEESEETTGIKDDFVSTSLRESRQDAYKHNVAHGLVLAVSAKSLSSIYHITKTALTVDAKTANKIGLNLDLAEKLNSVANSLLNYITQPSQCYGVIVQVAWGFRPIEEDFDEYVKPWYTGGVDHQPQLLRKAFKWNLVARCKKCRSGLITVPQDSTEEYRLQKQEEYENIFWKSCHNCGSDIDPPQIPFSSFNREYGIIITSQRTADKNPLWRFFFDVSNCLTVLGVTKMINMFSNYALPITQQMNALIAKNIVSENTYKEALHQFNLGGGEKENVEH